MEPQTSNFPSPVQEAPWNYLHLSLALIVGFFLQMLVLPCLCAIGNWRGEVAMYFNAMILLRMGVAYVRKETGNAWIIYATLCYTSAFWLHALTDVILFVNGQSH
ncbi:hypothetical protein [Prosthecobacter dejongeii]|uniref:Uncharacterized protein n=1 Tax=Prosthecobacter dejongeii TaxID=48465 RepID=A0A7W7YM93_9BACT|nr:hypothetical protein [Prosthecobacter dejongeii]MBB5038806.1 hypothetical protein [Prosthecobacter dejongeii]